MMPGLRTFGLAFIPIFVAVDAIGNIPVFISLVDGLSRKHKRKIIIESVTTAAGMAVVFMLVGKLVLNSLGITIADFQIAGGALLFVIAVRLLLPGASKGALVGVHEKDVGVFPLGTPLITGPAVLATTLIMLDSYGIIPTFVSLVLNMVVVWFTLIKSDYIMKFFGIGGTRAVAKVMYILLAAIAVMMVRRGITGAFLK